MRKLKPTGFWWAFLGPLPPIRALAYLDLFLYAASKGPTTKNRMTRIEKRYRFFFCKPVYFHQVGVFAFWLAYIFAMQELPSVTVFWCQEIVFSDKCIAHSCPSTYDFNAIMIWMFANPGMSSRSVFYTWSILIFASRCGLSGKKTLFDSRF